MKIKIKSEEKNFTIAFPTAWAFSRIGLHFLKKQDDEGDFSGLTPKSMRKIRQTIRKLKKKHKAWNLVEVDTSDGTYVRIRM